ncbi:MAG: cohesin domain-containing protein, partial [Saprospiraceae bacterium]
MRLFTFLFAFGAMLCAAPANALTFSISPTPQTVTTGTEVTVDIRVAGFSDVAGYQFSMTWNPAVLEFLSVAPKLPGMSASGNFNTSNAANGVLAHLFYAQGLGALSLPDGAILFTLKFLATGAAGTSSAINFTAAPTPIAAYNGDLQPLTVTALAGHVYIAAQAGFPVSGTVARASGMPVPAVLAALTGDATGSDLTGAAGDYGFENLASGSNLTITPAKTADPLECVSVRDILFIFKHILGIEPLPNPYAMVAADANRSKSITSFDAAELRKLILGIYAELPNGPSWQFIPADHVFPNPQNPFQPPAYPEFAEITDLQANAVRHFTAIKTGDVTDCTGDAQGLAFLTALASNANGQTGQQVTVDVTVQDFADVSGLQFSMQWNPAVAQFDGLSNFGLPGLDNAAFNTGQAASGKLSVCWWTDVLSGGQTLPNNTVLFSLTFTLVGPTGSSTPVAFVETPTKIEVVNGDCDPFGLSTGNGLILVSAQPPPPTAFQLVSGNANSANGAPVCAPVTASNFSDLTVVQFSLGWDPAVFAYQQLQNLHSGLGLSMAHFNINQSGNGRLGFAWTDPNANGVSLPNGTVLFEVCFTPVGSPGTSTPFSFPGSPVPAEATDANGDAVPVQTTSGTLSISLANANAPVTVYVSPTPQTVASGAPVSVDVRVANFASTAGYQFSMSWDPAVLQFQSVTPKLPGMSGSGNFNTANASAGMFSHLFFEQGLGTLNLSDGSVLFTLNFIATGAAGTSSPINFGDTPTPIVAYDGGLQPLTVSALAGLVHIAAQGGFSVSGTVARASGTPVPAVLAAMTGDATGSDLTGVAGDYGFENLAPGSNLVITPTKAADPLECVSVRDILFVFKHILGIEPLPNPYAMVAADANRSKSITSFDAAELRK